jgi:BTB/POZ domain
LIIPSEPHPIFVIILVGPDEKPYGIQKDFLCARSTHFREFFKNHSQEAVEHLVKLPDASTQVFGLAQNFMFTGKVIPDGGDVPSYEVLIGVWKLGHELGIDGLCDQSLEAMAECRRVTQHIPATPLLVQVWKDTPEGSSIRKLLLSWAAEYMRSSEARAEFARSLPQEVLSELVVAMSSLDTLPIVQVLQPSAPLITPRKNVHYLEDDESEDDRRSSKKNRRSSGLMDGQSPQTNAKAAQTSSARKPGPKPGASKPGPKPRRSGGANMVAGEYTSAQKLNFCSDLLTRMLSGPGKTFRASLARTITMLILCRVLDSLGEAIQNAGGPGERQRTGLFREDKKTDGSEHHQGQDGQEPIHIRSRVPCGYGTDLRELLRLLEEDRPYVGGLREVPEDLSRKVRSDEQVAHENGRSGVRLNGCALVGEPSRPAGRLPAGGSCHLISTCSPLVSVKS